MNRSTKLISIDTNNLSAIKSTNANVCNEQTNSSSNVSTRLQNLYHDYTYHIIPFVCSIWSTITAIAAHTLVQMFKRARSLSETTSQSVDRSTIVERDASIVKPLRCCTFSEWRKHSKNQSRSIRSVPIILICATMKRFTIGCICSNCTIRLSTHMSKCVTCLNVSYPRMNQLTYRAILSVTQQHRRKCQNLARSHRYLAPIDNLSISTIFTQRSLTHSKSNILYCGITVYDCLHHRMLSLVLGFCRCSSIASTKLIICVICATIASTQLLPKRKI